MIEVQIRTIRIFSVSDAGSVNVGTTINLVSKKRNGETQPPEGEAPPGPGPIPPPAPEQPSPTPPQTRTR